MTALFRLRIAVLLGTSNALYYYHKNDTEPNGITITDQPCTALSVGMADTERAAAPEDRQVRHGIDSGPCPGCPGSSATQ